MQRTWVYSAPIWCSYYSTPAIWLSPALRGLQIEMLRALKCDAGAGCHLPMVVTMTLYERCGSISPRMAHPRD